MTRTVVWFVRLWSGNVVSFGWLILYPALIYLASLSVPNGPLLDNGLSISDISMFVWPWVVPAIVFGRRADGSKYYSSASVLLWAVVPVLLFVGISFTQFTWFSQSIVVRVVAILFAAIVGWTTMILWRVTFRLWGNK